MSDEPVLLSREQWTELCQRATTAEAQAKLSHDMFVGAMADIKSMEREIEAAEAKVEAMQELLKRYRTEVPLGHQPHMIAHQVDELLRATDATIKLV